MGEIVPFVFIHDEEETPIRVEMLNGEPWFVGADVCRGLGIVSQRQALQRLKPYQRGVCQTDTPGGPQQMVIISESGLMLLAMRSDKERARRFQDWLAEEVLPTIRRTGKYELPVAEKKPCQPELLAAVNAIHGEVASMNDRLGRIEGQLGDRWKNFSSQAIRYAAEGVAKYNNCECIYCNDAAVVTKQGRPLGNARAHHANGNRRDTSPQNCTIPCADCHERIHNPNRADHIPAHLALSLGLAFHLRLRQKTGQIRPPNKPIKPWDFRAFTQADMGFPKIGKKHSA